MSFYASSFLYDNIPSETYNLFISEIGGGGNSTMSGSSSIDIYNKKIYRRAQPYFYGGTTGDVLKFDIQISSPDNIDSETSQLIQKWLFSNRAYKKLMIVQPDMEDVYFNCIFNNPQVIRVGNLIEGYNATIETDSPFGWYFPKTKTYTYTDSVINTSIVFNNQSDDRGGYLYPIISATMNSSGGDIVLQNASDSNRIFSFDNLSPAEVITVDNSLQTVSSSTGLRRLSKFNKKFFRLIPGVNNINVQGNISSLSITYQFVAKI